MQDDSSSPNKKAPTGLSPAQLYALGVGVIMALAGIVGMLTNASFGRGINIDVSTLIVFDLNGWLDIVHLATGLVGLYVARSLKASRVFAIVVGSVYGVLTVWGLFDNAILGLLPINDADTILHATIAALGITAAFAPDDSGSLGARVR